MRQNPKPDGGPFIVGLMVVLVVLAALGAVALLAGCCDSPATPTPPPLVTTVVTQPAMAKVVVMATTDEAFMVSTSTDADGRAVVWFPHTTKVVSWVAVPQTPGWKRKDWTTMWKGVEILALEREP